MARKRRAGGIRGCKRPRCLDERKFMEMFSIKGVFHLVGQEDIDDGAKISLHYALGKIYIECCRYDDAFNQYDLRELGEC